MHLRKISKIKGHLYSLSNITLGNEMMVRIPKIIEALHPKPFENCLNVMDFQFLQLFDSNLSNALRKQMLKHFINVSEMYYGTISFKDVICHKLLYKMGLLEKSKQILEKTKIHCDEGKIDLEFDSKIDLIQRLTNSLNLFGEFESMKEKLESRTKIDMLQKISTFLKTCKEEKQFSDILGLKRFLEKVGCPFNIKAFLFGELFYEEI